MGERGRREHAERAHDVHRPEGPQIVSVLELRLNQALIGEKTSADALNSMAVEIQDIMQKAGYKTGRLPDLR